MTSSVSIVIPTWNGLDLLKQFLPSVIAAAHYYGKHSFAQTEIIIVDDGSLDGTIDWLIAEGFQGRRTAGAGEGSEEEAANQVAPRSITVEAPPAVSRPAAPALRFIRNQTNRGFGETCNRGVEAAISPLVLLLNNDVDLAEDAIAPLVENFSDPALFAAHCRVIAFESGQECGSGKLGSFARGFIRVHRSYTCLTETGSEQSDTASACDAKLYSMFAGGGSAMFDREKFLSIGAFEALLSPFYWEDVELSHRAWKRGYFVVYEPRSVARHRVSSTIRKLDRRMVRRIQRRNRLIYHWIHLHDGRMLASHILWVALLALTAPLRLQPGFISSLAAALKALPRIRARRREEKRLAKRNDREVFEFFSTLERRPDVAVYDDLNDLQRLKHGQKVVRE
ncbi:MAG TPA: glycosyltransferase [Blastocatellia bacterium]|jgi:GT2 family glycosyltransferase